MSAFAYKLTFDLSEIRARDGLKSAKSGRSTNALPLSRERPGFMPLP